MNEAKSDKAMLDEIRAYLASSKTAKKAAAAAANSSFKSPYGPLPRKSDAARAKSSKTIKARKDQTHEEAVDYYTAQYMQAKRANKLPHQTVSQEDILIKDINMPYFDSIHKITAQLKLSDKMERNRALLDARYTSNATALPLPPTDAPLPSPPVDDESHASKSTLNALHISAEHLRNRFPRLLSGMPIDDLAVQKTQLRGDVWMAKFMEECYDEAFAGCSQEVADSRKIKRCGLYLGAVDAFPLVIQRLLSRVFSVLGVRQTVILEILVTLETASWRGAASDVKDDFSIFTLRSGRPELFAQFLSEEYDLSFLAIFLHNRDLLQRTLGVSLKDLNATGVWVEGGREGLATGSSYSLPESPPLRMVAVNSSSGEERAVRPPVDDCSRDPRLDSKVAPVRLPEGMFTLPDVGLPEAPLPGFEVSLLRALCGLSVPADKKLCAFLFAKVRADALQRTIGGLQRQSAMFDIKTAAPLSTYAKKATFIPVYSFLIVVLDQWRKVPVEQKYSFGADGQSMQSIKKLNLMYDRNCESMRVLEKTIFDVKTKIGQSNATIAQLEKAQRRLGRKWSSKMIDEEEMLELQRTRVQLTTAKAEKMPLETRLTLLQDKQAAQAAARDSLWEGAAAVYAIEEPAEEEYKYNPLLDGCAEPTPSWRTDVERLLLVSVTLHEEVEAATRQLRLDARQEQLQPPSPQPEDESPPPSPLKEEEEEEVDEFAVMVSSLQQEAHALAAVGSAEALAIGLTPVMVQVQEEERRRHEREAQVAERHAFEQEDALSRGLRRRWAVDREGELLRRAEALRAAAAASAELRLKARQLLAAEAQLVVDRSVCSAIKDISSALLVKRLQEEQQRAERLLAARKAQEHMDNDRIVASLVDSMANKVAARAAHLEAREIIVVRTTSSYEAAMYVSAGTRRAVAAICSSDDRINNICRHCADIAMAVAAEELLTSSMPAAAGAFVDMLASASCEAAEAAMLGAAIDACADLAAEEAVAAAGLTLAEELISAATEGAISAVIECALLDAAGSAAEALVERELWPAVASYFLELQTMREVIAERLRSQEMAANFVFRHILQEMVTEVAVIEMRDPWDILDVHPAAWFPEPFLANVEKRHASTLAKRQRAAQVTVLRVLWRGRMISRLRSTIAARELREVFMSWRAARAGRRQRCESTKCIQRFSRRCRDVRRRAAEAQQQQLLRAAAEGLRRQLLLRRAKGVVAYLLYRVKTKRAAVRVEAYLRERQFLLSFHTWLNKHNHLMRLRLERSVVVGKASLVVQCFVRTRLARARRRERESGLVIKRACRALLGLRQLAARRARARLLVETALALDGSRLFSAHKRAFKAWQRVCGYSTGIKKLARIQYTYRHRANFAKLKMDTAHFFASRTAMIVLIQSAGRMLVAKQRHLNYYRWRRGLCSLQSHVRRRKVIPQYTYDMYYYRRAKRIQRLYRGYVLRNRLTLLRIRDLHLASSSNNYERLSYYCRSYPELVSELDDEGNTALHNAAKNAAKRTLKLLLKSGLAANALNLAGYSALHMVIQSPSLRRDECCAYMLERGFDEDQVTPDGKTCLLLACENGRGHIVRRLLELGGRTNQPDHNGTTPLQAASANGYFVIAKLLIEAGADVNAPGYCGTLPFHDLIAATSLDIAKLLFCNGAYINVYEPYYYQTPLMWAGAAGVVDIVKLFLLQGADVMAKDYRGWTCVHHAACSNNFALYEAFRDANADFDVPDNEGNTPLHIATEYGAADFAKALLEGCCDPSVQNAEGNQPAHVAARLNNVDVLDEICRFDQHIGRMNYKHHTPLGVARFNCSREAAAFLQDHYRIVEIAGGRDEFGDLWWDRNIDATLDGWRVATDFHGKRTWYNDYTGEVAAMPPSIPSQSVLNSAALNQLNLVRKVTLVIAADQPTKHAYNIEYAAMKDEVEEMKFLPSKATIINKWARRKSAYLALRRLRKRSAKIRYIAIWVRQWLPRFMRWKRWQQTNRATRLQAAYRGFRLRNDFYHPTHGEYNERITRRARLHLRLKVWRAWRRYKTMRYIKCLEIARNPPRTLYDWAPLIKEAHWPQRTVGVYEEYRYPGTRGIYFYRHKVTGDCVFHKPSKMQQLDDMHWREMKELQSRGFTKRQESLVTTLQALWRGYCVRTYYLFIERAMEVSLNAQREYMNDPDSERNLANYAIHCHLVEADVDRARFLYSEAVRRMEWRGPDSPFILYAYAIFGFVTHDLDYSDVCFLLERARKAEEVREDQARKAKGELPSLAIQNGTYRHGKIFDFAKIGFYKYIARDHSDTVSWHNFAACCFLVYNDFNGSFDAFLEAFKTEPGNVKLKGNFDIMMRHYCGNSKERCDAKIRERMQRLAQIDADTQNAVTARREFAQKRVAEGIRIQRWYRLQKQKKAFATMVREGRERKARRALQARALHFAEEDDDSDASYKIEIDHTMRLD